MKLRRAVKTLHVQYGLSLATCVVMSICGYAAVQNPITPQCVGFGFVHAEFDHLPIINDLTTMYGDVKLHCVGDLMTPGLCCYRIDSYAIIPPALGWVPMDSQTTMRECDTFDENFLALVSNVIRTSNLGRYDYQVSLFQINCDDPASDNFIEYDSDFFVIAIA